MELKKPETYKPKVKVEDQYQLSEEDIQHFYENGYVKPFKVISEEGAEDLRQHLIDLITNKKSSIHQNFNFDEDHKTNGELTNEEIKAAFSQRINARNRHLEDGKLLNLFRLPAITERCAQLLGKDLLLWQSNFFPVAPKSKGTGIHQASTWMLFNWKTSTLYPKKDDEIFQVTVWVALTDATKKKACLITIRDSQWKIHTSEWIKDNGEDPTSGNASVYGKMNAKLNYDIKPEAINEIEVKAGECIIFSERVLHGSNDNTTDEWRWAVNSRIARTDTRLYTDKALKEGVSSKILGLKNIDMDKWKAILVRGKDTYGHNRMMSKEELEALDLQAQEV